ncbi:MAG: SUMF1/EgtB/PvdO family nonheme iron enzyme [Candidatus Coatesbacteria bacterium]|nr:SUMF1/EgtB/PvdO family nonheme iron enzyme [Candidatus Coatesbacteria bacterium]
MSFCIFYGFVLYLFFTCSPASNVNVKDGAKIVYIPSATFTMGTDSTEVSFLEDLYLKATSGDYDKEMLKMEFPRRQSTAGNFWIYQYEVTNSQYKMFCDQTKRQYPADPDISWFQGYFLKNPNYPVINVSYYDADAYAKWAGGDLPTEDEWERVARSSDRRLYPWGNSSIGFERANFKPLRNVIGDGYPYIAPVGSYPFGCNANGVMDLAGNVYEWCSTTYRVPFQDPTDKTIYRIIRGGSWSSSYFELRCAHRGFFNENLKAAFIGFRIVIRKAQETTTPIKTAVTSPKQEQVSEIKPEEVKK